MLHLRIRQVLYQYTLLDVPVRPERFCGLESDSMATSSESVVVDTERRLLFPHAATTLTSEGPQTSRLRSLALRSALLQILGAERSARDAR